MAISRKNPLCIWCHQPCWSTYSERRIHSQCNIKRVHSRQSTAATDPIQHLSTSLPADAGSSSSTFKNEVAKANEDNQLKCDKQPTATSLHYSVHQPATTECLMHLAGAAANCADNSISYHIHVESPFCPVHIQEETECIPLQLEYSGTCTEQSTTINKQDNALIDSSPSPLPSRKRRRSRSPSRLSPPPQPSPLHPALDDSGLLPEQLPLWRSPADMLLNYGYAFIPSDSSSRQLASEILRLPLAAAPHTTIAGDVEQYDLHDSLPTALRDKWHQLVHARAAMLNLHAADKVEVKRHILAEKLLVAATGKGQQAIHFDRDDVASKQKQVYTVILYCTPGQDSTACPLFQPHEFALPHYVSNDSSDITNAANLRDTIASNLLHPASFHSRPLQSGDMLIFPQSLPHFGTRNNSIIHRVAFFSILTPFTESDETQDDFQLYEWTYVGLAYGVNSVEFARSIYANRLFDPLLRFSSNESGRQTLDLYLSCLIKWNYISVVDAPNRVTRWKPVNQHEKRQLTDEEVHSILYANSTKETIAATKPKRMKPVALHSRHCTE